MGGHKAIEMYSLTVLEARSVKSGYQWGCGPSEILGHILLALLLASGGVSVLDQ